MPPKSDRNGTSPDADAPPEETFELMNVPFLGATRARALAGIGIRTMADLIAASEAQIASVKGVGLGNAGRIKAWLAAQPSASPGLPPPPPDLGPSTTPSLDPVLAQDNDTIFSGLGDVDALIAALRTSTAETGTSNKLERQFGKIGSVISELAEGPDTLSARQLQQGVKLLKRIIAALEEAAGGKLLSEKKQEALAQELRDHRKALQKALGD